MLTLDDINKLPNDPSEDHLRALGLLPQVPPTPSIVPHLGAGEKIPALSPVTPAAKPAPVANDWRSKLSSPVAPAPLPPLNPPLTPAMGAAVKEAPDLGAGPSSAMSETAYGATPGVSFPTLPALGFKERQALPTTSEGVAPGSKESFEAQLQRIQDQKANPWGSPENHPGLLGKIGHYAAKIGNIAGDIVAPGTMANIPGTDINRRLEERGLEKKIAAAGEAEEAAKTGASQRELRSAEAKKDIAEAERTPKEPKATPEEETFDDLITGGPNGGPKLKPDGTPYTHLEAYQATKQAGAAPKEKTPANSPATPEAIADYQERLKSVGLDGKSAATFSNVPHGTTMAELEKRYTDAKSLREMGQKDRENAIRDQERRDAQAEHTKEHEESFADKIEKEGRTLVRYHDPTTGRSIVQPLAQAKKDGIAPEDMEEVAGAEKGGIQDARAAVHLLNKTGKEPSQMGVKQLVDQLDKDGKLGVVSSRMNSWLAGGVGALPGDDPRVMALLDKAELAMTLTMKAHFGASGGRSPQMLEHFLNMANAKKMSGPALRAGFDAVGDYMRDKAELPEPRKGGGGGGGGKGGGHSFTINGKPYENVPDDVYQRAKKKPGFKE